MTITTSFGTLTSYATGEAIRPATNSEWLRSALAVADGKPEGAFEQDVRELPAGFGTVFVEGGPDASVSRDDVIALRGEAGTAGDQEQVTTCDRALNVNGPHLTSDEIEAAWDECTRVILANRAES